jgi:hypothetical protein
MLPSRPRVLATVYKTNRISLFPFSRLAGFLCKIAGVHLTPKYGSDLSPIAAEYGSISACSTQNKAKRANKIVFLLLIRDQEVDGSNPFAPTIYLS